MRRATLITIVAFSAVSIGCAREANEPPRVAARDSAGITIVENIEPAWQAGEEWRLSSEPAVRIGGLPARAYRLSPEGMIADSLPVFPGREFDFRTSERSVGLGPPPFGRQTVFAVAGDGFYGGSQDDFQIDYYNQHGRLKEIVRWPAHERLVTPDDMESYRRHELDGIESENMRRRAEEIIDGQVYWIEEYHRDWDPDRSWIVFDADHKMLGRVEMPGDFIVHQIGRDFVLGWAWDELDVEYTLMYQLIKPRATEPSTD